jgi:hypothetical protein
MSDGIGDILLATVTSEVERLCTLRGTGEDEERVKH